MPLTRCFNTQPPEGGWLGDNPAAAAGACFNTQPPEGGWFQGLFVGGKLAVFQHTAA